MMIVRRRPMTTCAGVNSPDLIGQLVEVLPHLPVDVDFPYPCSSGLLGNSDGSTTALCSGLVTPPGAISGPLPTALPTADNDAFCFRLLCGSVQLVPSAARERSHLKSVRPATSVHLDHPYQHRVRPAPIQARLG